MKIDLEKIFFILTKKFNSGILISINYFKYKSNKYINLVYLYIEINFKYIKKIWIKSENLKNNENYWMY
jgi:hypothetical protein